MKEREFFIDKVEETSEIEVEIQDVHKSKMKGLGKLFKLFFGRKPNEFNAVKDLLYYKTGVPNEDSTSKLSKILDKFVLATQYYSYMGKLETIQRVLNNYGIEITVREFDPRSDGRTSSQLKFEKNWERMYPGKNMNDVENMLEFLLDEAMEIEGAVVALKKEVKEVHVEDVMIKCEVEAKNFMQAVNLKTKSMRGKDNTDKINKIEKDIDELSEVVDMVK